MLGGRTKQINAYGKRGKRVIDATMSSVSASNRDVASTEIISIFDDLPPPPNWTGVASKMKRRENAAPAKAKAHPPKLVGLQKKKRLSPVLSPIKKKQTSRVAQLKSTEAAFLDLLPVVKPKPKPIATGQSNVPIVLSASPPRAPLSSVLLNIPCSPAASQTPLIPARKINHKLQKPFSPFVDVDITILDDDGRTIRSERRVSKIDVDTNFIKSQHGKSAMRLSKSVITDGDSEEEAIKQSRRPKRLPSRKNMIVISDDSEEEYIPTKKITQATKTMLSDPPNSSRTKSVVEVVIPAARYKLPRATAETKHTEPVRPPPPPKKTQEQPQHRIGSPQASQTRFQLVPSPTLKPRQLTPIRGGRKRIFGPPSPPSPTTPTDFDLSIDFSDLSTGIDFQSQGTYHSDFEAPVYLKSLLEECHQEISGPHNFSTFIDSFPYDHILQSARESKILDMQFRKIGEASYSEVFGIGDVVLKVIPLRDELRVGQLDDDDGPAPSDAKDVCKEIIVTRAMGDVYGGFVRLLKTYVVKGRYPEVLLQLWDEYNERKGSESVRPDTFKVSQVYAIIVLPNGGPDLEAYTFHNASRSGWRQCCSLFWQVAKSLAHAEQLVSFEHRDLHWGQILVKNLPTQTNALKSLNPNQKSKSKSHRVFMDDLSHGVEATVIDLGLSRMDAGDGGDGERTHWTPFDEEVFMGEGDYQFDVYRMMKDLTGGAWDDFHPITNVLWLHYLLRKLLLSKGLKPPAIPRKPKGSEAPAPATTTSEAAFSEKDCYDCLVDIESWLGKCVGELTPNAGKATAKGKGRRKPYAAAKPSMVSSGPARAGEIVAYGVKKGWIEPTSHL